MPYRESYGQLYVTTSGIYQKQDNLPPPDDWVMHCFYEERRKIKDSDRFFGAMLRPGTQKADLFRALQTIDHYEGKLPSHFPTLEKMGSALELMIDKGWTEIEF